MLTCNYQDIFSISHFSESNKHLAIKITAISLCKDCSHFVFAVFYKLIPAHNVFVLYISQYLTFALHFVGQGPVTMYNNFIYAIGFSQHFNGFNWIHISLGAYCIHSELNFIDVSLCSVPLRPIALSSFLSRCWGFCASSSLSNSSEWNKWSLWPLSVSHTHRIQLKNFSTVMLLLLTLK